MDPIDDVTVTYEVMFDPGFDWRKAGKLPGPVGVVDGVSPTFPTGGKPDPDNLGWSCRLMWLQPNAGGWIQPDGTRRHAVAPVEIIVYPYHPGQPDQFGDNVFTGFVPPVGSFFPVEIHVAMNTVGKKDGILQVGLGDKLVTDLHDWTWRTRPDVHCTHYLNSVFPGGGDDTYTAPVDRYVSIRGVRVTTPAA